MSPTARFYILPALLLVACATPQREARLDASNLEAWRTHLTPGADELAWESLPWLSSYADGVLAAQEQRRPLLLWVMNGHPLGCT
ncbi:MAG TPA: hypothetical protein VES36_03890 [Candidatus Limnocylindrales bacterium]|nr:hypothetical protein [Candidatus Limnocylindrales bacterium]